MPPLPRTRCGEGRLAVYPASAGAAAGSAGTGFGVLSAALICRSVSTIAGPLATITGTALTSHFKAIFSPMSFSSFSLDRPGFMPSRREHK